jgi:hypothetical protein
LHDGRRDGERPQLGMDIAELQELHAKLAEVIRHTQHVDARG